MSCPGADCPPVNESIALANQLNVNALLDGDRNAVLVYRLLLLAREAFASGRFLHAVDSALAKEMFELGKKLSRDALGAAAHVMTKPA